MIPENFKIGLPDAKTLMNVSYRIDLFGQENMTIKGTNSGGTVCTPISAKNTNMIPQTRAE